jgi:hypothetical protein
MVPRSTPEPPSLSETLTVQVTLDVFCHSFGPGVKA